MGNNRPERPVFPVDNQPQDIHGEDGERADVIKRDADDAAERRDDGMRPRWRIKQNADERPRQEAPVGQREALHEVEQPADLTLTRTVSHQ